MTTGSVRAKALYLHIPFCDALCPYCDFAKVYTGLFSESLYLKRLKEEVEGLRIPDDSLETIYVGGGTPSALSAESLSSLLSYLHGRFPSVQEFTVEANPESLSEEKILLLSRNGVNRVSLGVQSVKEETLRRLGRLHAPEQAKRAVRSLKGAGIKNVSLDFIYGIPFAPEDEVESDLSFALEEEVPHLSFYSLQIEPGTAFYNEKMAPLPDEELRRQYDEIVKTLRRHGYVRYEVSNFARPGFSSRHNKTYWKDLPYYAAGVSASGYLGDVRYTNTRSVPLYLAEKNHRSEEKISTKEEEFEYLMLNLRLEEGFLLKDFRRRFKKDFLTAYREKVEKVKDEVVVDDGHFALKPEYLYVMDSILLELLPDID